MTATEPAWRAGDLAVASVQITTDKLAYEPASSKSALTLFSPLDRGHSPYALRMTTFASVHGSWHGAWCWELLSPFLRRLGHDVVAMDLPCGDGSASFVTYADVVCDALEGSPGARRSATNAGRLTVRPVRRLRRLRLGNRHEARWRGRGHGRARDAGLRRGRRCRSRDRLLGGLLRYWTSDLFGLGGTDVAEDHTKRSHGDYRADTDDGR